jgi:GTP pyrophosphokinase
MNSGFPEIALLAQGFAMCAHRNQRRKYEDILYVVHCERVACTVAEYTDDRNVIAAAFMPDVLEDTDVTAEEMCRVFGDTIRDWCWKLTVL